MKVGDVINDYTIIRYIDNGSFGKVWEVRKDGKSYALKTCSSIEATDIKRFEREYRLMASLDNENVIKTYCIDTSGTEAYLIMEYAETSLKVAVEKGLSIKDKFLFAIQTCKGGSFLHANNVLHRDIKPDNVLLKNGVAKIGDFGIGRFINRDTTTLTTTAETMGTFGYAAPELTQPGGFKNYCVETDIFALGGLLCNIFTDGALPYCINPKYVPNDIYPIIQKCTAPDSEDRYHGVEEIIRDLYAVVVARESYTTMAQVYEARGSLSAEEMVSKILAIFQSSATVSDVVNNFIVINKLWIKLVKAQPTIGDLLYPIVRRIFEQDEHAWLSFEDIDVIGPMVINLFESSKDITTKQYLLKMGIGYTVGYNRWAPMRSVFERLIQNLDANTVVPYLDVIKECSDKLYRMERAINVSMPDVVKDIMNAE